MMAAGIAVGQTARPGTDHAKNVPTYDVVTIRVNGAGGWPDSDTTADSYVARNFTLKRLLEDAYGIHQQFILGVPRALESVRFDVQAKVVDADAIRGLKDEQRPPMLQQALGERFRLKLHEETRLSPVYDMVVTPRGAKLKPATAESIKNSDMEVRRRMLTATSQSMAELADALTVALNRTVIDKTGIAGTYDFEVHWSPDGSDDAADVMAPPGLLPALEDQLGLKLRPDKGQVRVLVVDAAEMPGEN